MKFLPLVLKNLLRKKTRSGLTIGSILLPSLVICLLGTFVAMLDADPSQGRGMFRLAVRHKVSIANVLPASHLEKIRTLPGVKAVTPFNWFGGRYVDFSAFNVFERFAVDPPAFFDVFDAEGVVDGSAEAWKADRRGLLVGELLMRKYGWRLGQQVTLTGDIWPGTYAFTIRAVYRGNDEAAVFFDQKVIDEALPHRAGRYTMIWVKGVDAAAARDLIPRINALFENSPWPVRAETEKEFQNNYIALLGNVKLFFRSLAAVIAAVILLIAANTMAMAARERATEFAVMRAIGFTKGKLFALLLSESVCLGVAGGTAGLVLFLGLFPRLRAFVLYSPLAGLAAALRVYPGVLAAAFGLTVLVGILAGLVPAIHSSRRSIVDGLRQVA
ncbi:MAG TPA: FtsX-like permease family protein [Thermoanaerobaculia bacterium]|nr:FtsX-like permease family protein [Thermoanaerobaculia bacterium]